MFLLHFLKIHISINHNLAYMYVYIILMKRTKYKLKFILKKRTNQIVFLCGPQIFHLDSQRYWAKDTIIFRQFPVEFKETCCINDYNSNEVI